MIANHPPASTTPMERIAKFVLEKTAHILIDLLCDGRASLVYNQGNRHFFAVQLNGRGPYDQVMRLNIREEHGRIYESIIDEPSFSYFYEQEVIDKFVLQPLSLSTDSESELILRNEITRTMTHLSTMKEIQGKSFSVVVEAKKIIFRPGRNPRITFDITPDHIFRINDRSISIPNKFFDMSDLLSCVTSREADVLFWSLALEQERNLLREIVADLYRSRSRDRSCKDDVNKITTENFLLPTIAGLLWENSNLLKS